MRNSSVGFGAALVLVATAFGCGGSSGNSYTCNFAAAAGLCWEWTAPQSLTSAQQSQLQTACTTNNPPGTFSTGANCPSASRVGTCSVNISQVPGESYKIKFYSPTWTAATGQQACPSSLGSWTPG